MRSNSSPTFWRTGRRETDLVSESVKPARDFEPDEEPRDAVVKKRTDVGVGDAGGVDPVRLKLVEDLLGAKAVRTVPGGGGEGCRRTATVRWRSGAEGAVKEKTAGPVTATEIPCCPNRRARVKRGNGGGKNGKRQRTGMMGWSTTYPGCWYRPFW